MVTLPRPTNARSIAESNRAYVSRTNESKLASRDLGAKRCSKRSLISANAFVASSSGFEFWKDLLDRAVPFENSVVDQDARECRGHRFGIGANSEAIIDLDWVAAGCRTHTRETGNDTVTDDYARRNSRNLSLP